MTNAFQRTAFQHHYGFQGDGTTPPQTRPYPAPAGKAKKWRHSVVEIDGERFTVRNEEEAAALLERTRELAQEQAPVVAKSALTKARKIRRKTGAQTLPTLEVAVPEVKVVSGDDAIRAMVAAAQQWIDTTYLQAARDAEIAYWLRRKQLEDEDEEDAISILLMHL